MALQHWLFVNKAGRKFKTTTSGKARYLNDKKLACVLIGECDERGVQINPESLPKQVSRETSQQIKEILEVSKQPVVVEQKFTEEVIEKFKPETKNVKAPKKQKA